MLRLVMLGFILVVAVRMLRGLVAAVLRALAGGRGRGGVSGRPKRPHDDIDMSKVKDADFRDIKD